ncbi:unnamed protein product [Cuscuta europaea]|uniref:Uncharacterized protein n=1 Tax=Cuscuta europaea TaxID=41803 RepID=A0A9P1E9B6_CUSEU|nr:unnamed protein product [Cuscuta europaea]
MDTFLSFNPRPIIILLLCHLNSFSNDGCNTIDYLPLQANISTWAGNIGRFLRRKKTAFENHLRFTRSPCCELGVLEYSSALGSWRTKVIV